jgi:hypothetical protein
MQSEEGAQSSQTPIPPVKPPASAPPALPGYYWDAERRRYFKGKRSASSAPIAAPPPPPVLVTSLPRLLSRRQERPDLSLRRLLSATPLTRLRRHESKSRCSGQVRLCSEPFPEMPDRLFAAVAVHPTGQTLPHVRLALLNWNERARTFDSIEPVFWPADVREEAFSGLPGSYTSSVRGRHRQQFLL